MLGINGLQPYLHAHKHHIELKDVKSTARIRNQPPYYVKEIAHAYDADNTGYTGANTKTAILIDTFPLDSDLTAFWQANSIPQTLANIEKVNVFNSTDLPPPEGEETLDVSWSSSIAPASKVRIYATSDLFFTSLDKGLQRIVTDLPSQPTLTQLSISLGLGELYISDSEVFTESQYFATIASFGVSIFRFHGRRRVMPDASGHDPNAGPLQAEYESTDPSVTAVGGTTLVLTPSSGDVSSEIAWADGGGGESVYFSRPSYQTGPGVPRAPSGSCPTWPRRPTPTRVASSCSTARTSSSAARAGARRPGRFCRADQPGARRQRAALARFAQPPDLSPDRQRELPRHHQGQQRSRGFGHV